MLTLLNHRASARHHDYRQALHQFTSGRWTPEFQQTVSRIAHSSHRANERTLALKTLLATGSPALHIDGQLTEWANELAEKRHWSFADRKLANFLATGVDHYDSWSNHQQFFNQLINRQPRSLANCPALLCELAVKLDNNDNTLQPDTWLSNVARRSLRLHKRIRNAKEAFRSGSIDTIAIVGNAPGLLQAKNGDAIDSADCVLRFNQIVINDRLQTSTGQRTDIWCVNPGFDFRHLPRFPSRYVWLSGYLPYHRPSAYWLQLENQLATRSDTTFMHASHSLWCELVAQLHAPPSAGLLCLYTLMQTPCRLQVYGFSGLESDDHKQSTKNQTQSHHYGDGGADSGRHNWAAEQRLLRKIQHSLSSQANERISFH